MSDFLGSDFQVAIQKRLQAAHDWIKDTPEMSNGGRILNILDAEKVGWPCLRELAAQDKCISFTALPLEPTLTTLKAEFGAGWDIPHWDVFFGDAAQVCTSSQVTRDAVTLQAGWTSEVHANPTDDLITEVQELNVATGIGPSPAWYMRGDAMPTMTACIRDARGKMVATAMANCRYHPQSRFADHIFQGSVSVLSDHRGKKLGNLVSAIVFLESHKTFGWKTALSQVKPTNIPSRRMIEACGLTADSGLVTLSVIEAGQQITR